MAAILLKTFNGLKPISEPVLLENADAQRADNVMLNTGALRPLKTSTVLRSLFKVEPKTIYRFDPENNQPPESYWLEFDKDTDVMRSPIAQDQWNRLYWTDGDLQPKYAPAEMVIVAAADGSLPGHGYDLGVPEPSTAPTVTDFTEPTEITTISRNYVLTYWKSATSKESTPCKPTTVRAVDGEPVTFSSLPTTNKGDSGITHKRLYRLVPDPTPATTKTYRRLAEIDILEPEYVDEATDAEAALLPALTIGVDTPFPPLYPPVITAVPISTDEGTTTPILRHYVYVVAHLVHGGVTYNKSAPSPMMSIMADESQTVTISGLVNTAAEGTMFNVYRMNAGEQSYRLVEQIPVTQTSLTDNMKTRQLGESLGSWDGPDDTSPPIASVSVNSSTVGSKLKRMYMVTFIDVSNKESPKSPDSELVEVHRRRHIGVSVSLGTDPVRGHQEASVPAGHHGIERDHRYQRCQLEVRRREHGERDLRNRRCQDRRPSRRWLSGCVAGAAAISGQHRYRHRQGPALCGPGEPHYVYTYVTAYDEEGPPSPDRR
jgi:hypothetical protein